ncbi:hypothetical protein BGZ65_008652 [Modicella reniformis]|uniref:Uncharacterized protein n=1 Tax=Modicella reniformis TaxID=1440133 RepID=A0A9P6J6Q1_9FUNG|nr:hypothetical protein BGZ65_008652 [Modicella reniformis]
MEPSTDSGNNSDEQPMQAFQSLSMDDTIDIPTRTDLTTGKYIILWRDIRCVFENARFIRNGESQVLFMTDENFQEINPRRIKYYPGVVLEVVVRGKVQVQTDSSSEATLTEYNTDHPTEYATDVDATIEHRVDTKDLVRYEGKISGDRDSVLDFLHSGNIHLIQSLGEHFGRLRTEMNQSKANQERLVQNQQIMGARQLEIQQLQLQTKEELCVRLQEMHHIQRQTEEHLIKKQQELNQLQQHMQEELAKKHEEIIELQQQSLDKLATIQNRQQAVLTQVYELHEHPIPRLFIVLPKTMEHHGREENPDLEQFRLYFLCECGTHTMVEHCKNPPEIHLAKHEGYDLNSPTEFFQIYGSYILTLMNMVKIGITAAGLVVPPLANLKILNGMDSAQDHYLRSNIVPLVDYTINTLEDFKSNVETSSKSDTEHTHFDGLDVLEGANLRQLESFLKAEDKNGILGNLYRIVTPEGHVKWVCLDHYRANDRDSVIQRLRDVVEVNSGMFIEETGRIEIKVGSNILAKQFYDTMVKASGIQELVITLEWNATMDDLRALSKAVTMANVIQLTVDGTHLKNPTLDVNNRGRRYDPILKIASNGRMQSLNLKGFDDFFFRVSESCLATTYNLQVFSLEWINPVRDDSLGTFVSFLKCCPTLTTLKLKLSRRYAMEDHITKELGNLFNPIVEVKVDPSIVSRDKKTGTGFISRWRGPKHPNAANISPHDEHDDSEVQPSGSGIVRKAKTKLTKYTRSFQKEIQRNTDRYDGGSKLLVLKDDSEVLTDPDISDMDSIDLTTKNKQQDWERKDLKQPCSATPPKDGRFLFANNSHDLTVMNYPDERCRQEAGQIFKLDSSRQSHYPTISNKGVCQRMELKVRCNTQSDLFKSPQVSQGEREVVGRTRGASWV